MTARQQQVLDFVGRYQREHGFPPTVREIQHDIGVRSTSTVVQFLNLLERDGHISRVAGSPRSIKVLGGIA